MVDYKEIFNDNALVFYVFAASIIEVIAAAEACNGNLCTGYLGYAVAVVSIAVSLYQASIRSRDVEGWWEQQRSPNKP